MIRSKDEDCVPYVGSTTKQYLSQRMVKHRNSYKHWKENPEKNKKKFVTAFKLFEKYGVENCYIELLESCSCKISEELLKKEREWFDKLNCVNIVRPMRTEEEVIEQIRNDKKKYYKKKVETVENFNAIHYQKYKDSQKENKEIYTKTHKKEKAEYDKKRREEKADEIKQKKREYYHKKKEEKRLSAIGTLCSTTVTETL